MTARKAGWSQAEAARRERATRISPWGTRRLAETILATIIPDPPDIIELRRLELEKLLSTDYRRTYRRGWRERRSA